jgi:hypothetical protein
MKSCLAVIFLGALLTSAWLGAQSSNPVAEKPFAPAGRIEIDLESGDYDVQPSPDNRIRVTALTQDSRVKLAVNVNGTHADVNVANTPNNFHATIEVPATSDITLRLTAGDLKMGPIKGNKDIASRAGDMVIQVGDPNDYSKVDASVAAGDLNASAFNTAQGGLFRSFHWTGPGKYTMRVRLTAGDLTLLKK